MHMRRLLVVLVAMLFTIGGSAGLVSAQATPAPSGNGSSNPVNPQIGDSVTFFGQSGSAIGTLKVTKVLRGWKSYQQYEDPDQGNEYVAIYLTVSNTATRGSLEVQAYDFRLQDAQGLAINTSYVEGRDTLKTKPLTDTVTVAPGKSANILLVFQTFENQPLSALYWMPQGYILNLADLSKS